MFDNFDVLKLYRVTEKSNKLSVDNNCYTFEVFDGANKVSIRKAVELFFKVKVVDVRILNRVPKIKKSRARKSLPGVVGGMKKAMVKLAKDSKIDII